MDTAGPSARDCHCQRATGSFFILQEIVSRCPGGKKSRVGGPVCTLWLWTLEEPLPPRALSHAGVGTLLLHEIVKGILPSFCLSLFALFPLPRKSQALSFLCVKILKFNMADIRTT